MSILNTSLKCTQSPFLAEVLIFFHRCITNSFESKASHEETILEKGRGSLPAKDIMTWLGSVQNEEAPLPEPREPFDTIDPSEQFFDDLGEEPEEVELPEINAYQVLIRKSPAYHWLLGVLRREFNTEPGSSDSLDYLRDQISAFLPHNARVSKQSRPPSHRILYRVDMDLLNFVRDQGYEGPSECIGKIITISGTEDYSQALTCVQYLEQIWPSTASHMLSILKLVIEKGSDTLQTCKLRNPLHFSNPIRSSTQVSSFGIEL